ncbi:MAG: DHH family phosphoesterase [Methylicorpusculum sp.]|uniref:DHH family phosphoesterase n=1 Tax=Methylicorpusculum sp. TaxID=2713644 RepID=UPI0027219CFE|nr:DHH family phosphoesterase [Methylicorpusculum sp.]MDO8938553.1 DHH family phosphoesterase [Methylicorpusculum sp.]MDP2202103.1 DHH family phosphoesterase [Methylicorpusculum sp.]
MQYDVFNGDADGICALIQLRLAEPVNSTLITGVKRDISLLETVTAEPGDRIVVLDISLEKNCAALNAVLKQGATVFYVDHHRPGEIPVHSNLTTLIDTDTNICTSLLVDQHLQGRFRLWAITAAFGDNLDAVALKLAADSHLSSEQIGQLKQLGVCINYNSYGHSIEDLHLPPAQLYKEMVRYLSPFEFIANNRLIHQTLINGFEDDMNQALQLKPEYSNEIIAVYVLPDETWSRRISGVFANELANGTPNRAHAIVSLNEKGGYLVSVRAPINNKSGADEICAAFPSGGGRKAAAGINHLEKASLPTFIKQFESYYAN